MNKLVRTKIPEIIQKSGRSVDVVKVTGDDLRKLLADKIVEEANELAENIRNGKEDFDVLAEMADVKDVLTAIKEVYGMSDDSISGYSDAKTDCRGSFVEVEYPNSLGDDIEFYGTYISKIGDKSEV